MRSVLRPLSFVVPMYKYKYNIYDNKQHTHTHTYIILFIYKYLAIRAYDFRRISLINNCVSTRFETTTIKTNSMRVNLVRWSPADMMWSSIITKYCVFGHFVIVFRMRICRWKLKPTVFTNKNSPHAIVILVL